jgi:hypothetical protein
MDNLTSKDWNKILILEIVAIVFILTAVILAILRGYEIANIPLWMAPMVLGFALVPGIITATIILKAMFKNRKK